MRSLFRNLKALDAFVCIRIFRWRGKEKGSTFMVLMSRFGDGYAYIVVGLAVLILDFSSAGRLFSAAAVTFPLTLIGQKTLKMTTRRPRPSDAIPEIRYRVRPPDRFSFPSGHTASAFAVARLLSVFYPFSTIPCYAFASLVGLSRVRNGVHYPGDVLAGFILGMLMPRIAFLIIL